MIQLQGVSKSYGETRALEDLTLDLKPGEIHAICGENGAGKSTLNRILSGLTKPDQGQILVDQIPLELGSLSAAEAAGIAMVHQESAIFSDLTAPENHEVMREPVAAGGFWLRRDQMRARTAASLKALGESQPLEGPLGERSLAQRQMVSIARALSSKCRLLILDEPTASLSHPEAEALFQAIRDLRKQGLAILYVSHRLEEIFALADRVSVLRDGRLISTQTIAETSPSELVALMVGREIEAQSPTRPAPGERVLSLKNLSREPAFQNISFDVHKGEVVALAGLVGSGRSEIARVIFGLDRPTSGTVESTGKVALVPEDRQHEGLHLALNVTENVALTQQRPWLLNPRGEHQASENMIRALSIKAGPETVVGSLSGGNQQKVLLAKWLVDPPALLILDEPTRGVDVGAKAQIHQLIRELAERGTAILLISSEMPEVLALATRILVIRQGEVSGEVQASEATQENLLGLALPLATENTTHQRSGRKWTQEGGVGVLLGLTMIAATAMNPAFLQAGNLLDMLVKVAPALIVGSMMTLLILAREIDISVGSLMGLCAAVLGIVSSPDRLGLPPAVAAVACIATGGLFGALNGLLVSVAKVPSIIVTLGMLTILRGVTEKLMAGEWIENLPGALRHLGTGSIYGVQWIIVVAALATGVGYWLARRTPFGLRVYALGSNPSVAHLRGLPETRLKLALFTLTGLAAGVAALFSATQLQVIESGFGTGFELVVIAAVIVGGTSIRGGRGTILGTVLGACLLGIISTVLIFMKLGDGATYWERAIQGALILVAVVGDRLWRQGEPS